MILQWAQSLLQFLLWFAVASVGGCTSYWALRLARPEVRNLVGKGAVFAISLLCLAGPLSILILGVSILALVPSFASAFCEKALDEDGGTWSSHLGISILTYLLSMPLDLIILLLLAQYSVNVFATTSDEVIFGVLAGLLLTPASISLLRWIIHNSHVRPGVERHLREPEE